MNHLCVIDGDVVVGVLSRERLRTSLRKNKNEQLHNIMERKILVLNENTERETALKAIGFHDKPYALLVDTENQVRGLVEREPANGVVQTDDAASAFPGRVIELSAEQQAGASGDAIRVYSMRPQIKQENSGN